MTHGNKQGFLALLLRIVAIAFVAIVWLSINTAHAAEIELTQPSRGLLMVSGGSSGHEWHIQYRNGLTGSGYTYQVLSGPGPIAYFAHGTVLRQIDAERGIVTGRWRFPGTLIRSMALTDGILQIEVEEQTGRQSFRRTVSFDPDKPEIPYWPTYSLVAQNISIAETLCCRILENWQAQDAVLEAENAARRDPYSPWLQLQTGWLYRTLDRPEARTFLERAVRMDPPDFRELLPMSTALDGMREHDLAREAFERGYADYWKRGNDPRLLTNVFARFSPNLPAQRFTEDLQSEMIDRAYRVGPWVEGAEYAWDLYSRLLESRGDEAQAKQWNARAREASARSLAVSGTRQSAWTNALLPIVVAVPFALISYVVILFVRYLPQRRLQLRAEPSRRRGSRLFNTQYWSRAERVAFATMGVAGWLVLGLAGSYSSFSTRATGVQTSVLPGSFGGPATVAFFENGLPESRQQKLLLAMALQHDHQPERAEPLYRQLTEYPQSWNNLGAILKDSGKAAEASQAFQQALRLDPEMVEAKFNLGLGSTDFWTEQQQKYAPSNAMLAPPSREQFQSALGGGSPWLSVIHAIEGPFSLRIDRNRAITINRVRMPAGLIYAIVTIVVVCVVFGLYLIFRQSRDVTQLPYRSQTVIELIMPGVAPEWRYFGGIALLAWSYLILRAAWLFLPRLLFAAGMLSRPPRPPGTIPNLARAFAVPVSDPEMVRRLQTPDLVYLIAGTVLLFTINALLLWRSRHYVFREAAGKPGSY